MMDTKMMAIIATMVLPMFAAAREGPDCPADPYVRCLSFRKWLSLIIRQILKPIRTFSLRHAC